MKRYRHDPNAPSHLRKLLESARGDDIGENRRRLVAERLGIASAAAAPSDPSRKSSPPGTRASLSVGGVVLTAIALIGGTTTYVAINHPSPAESPPAAVSLTAAPPSPTSILEPPTSIVEPPPAPVAEPPSMPSMPSMHVGALREARSERAPIAKPNPVAEPGAGPKGGTGDLRLEIAALDGVRRATEGGRPRDALTLLDDYAARFPAGKLREEALVLRIEALHASGDEAGAQRLAQQLLRSSPNTPYAARVQSALAKASPKKE
ncbi:MAG: hypothetical protein BGO98_18200 [Myxococcales bacterium 68-20]|nr:hypothetical protein [Myxococcales bacterium]OJY23869.1 MAG: hypothetical protein BGO98_18200 [Myxococcales bacterium 68-20]